MVEHLAIMRNPWMNLLISGKKTIESRISQRRIAPWNKISKGDWIYFRLSGWITVSHKAQVNKVLAASGSIIFNFMRKYQDEIGIDEEYIQSKTKCNYLTLMFLDPLITLDPHEQFPFRKRDQRAWIANFRREDSL